MTFADRSLAEFLEAVAAGSATPGGGSVAAVGGAAGAALGEMVCSLTAGKEGYADVADDLAAAGEALGERRVRLLELADEDAEAFDAVMAAYRTPEDEGRAAAIEAASKRATEVPLETAEACVAVLGALVEVAEKGNPNSVTDAGAGALLAHAALRAALYNVAVNLGSIGDASFVEEASARAESLAADASERLTQVLESVDAAV